MHTILMKKKATKGKKLFVILISAPLIVLMVLFGVFFSIYFSAHLDSNAIIAERAKLIVCDVHGNEIGADELNRYVEYEDINTNIINAFVALEDKRFFKHSGVDLYRTAGALLNNVKAGYFKEGGSTITQQLAKNTQLTGEKTLSRKIKELKLARDIEKRYSKEAILEMYLNAIYYGNGIFGIDSACKNYFNKSPAEVNIAESAILAGIVKSPQNYSPINSAEKALSRMKLVLKLMLEQDYIDEQEYYDACKYEYKQPEKMEFSPYFSATISEACEILNISEKELIKSPYKIYTYYDENEQYKLSEICASDDYKIKTQNGDDAYYSVTVANNIDGGITAFYSNKKYDVMNFRRQPGSAIKPLAVYSPALEKKLITPADVFTDEKMDFNGYVPSNYQDVYVGKTDVENAVKSSINTVAVQIFNSSDRDYALRTIQGMGITTADNDNNLSLALGGMTYGVTTKEMVEAYMTLANGGLHGKCGFIREIMEENDSIKYKKVSAKQRILREDTAYIMTDMLLKTAQSGTAKKLSAIPYEIAAKTGTVSASNGKNSDAWCVSYTTDRTVCTWYGGSDYSDEQSFDTTGGGIPTLLTANIYRAMKNPQKTCFSIPESVIELEIDTYARNRDNVLYLANYNTPLEYRKKYYFSVTNCPRECSPYFIVENPQLSVQIEDDYVELSFERQYIYDYKLIKEDLSEGYSEIIMEYHAENNDKFQNEVWTDENTDAGVYNYLLEIYFEGRLIGSANTGIIFTHPYFYR